MEDQKSIMLLVLWFTGLSQCQDRKSVPAGYDFHTYKVFKVESTMAGDNSDCICTMDADVTGWNQWSQCQGHQQSFQCHRGIQYRWRTCSLGDALRSCKEREWKYCYNEESCTGEWQSWINAADGGLCSHSCGGGVVVRVRACMKNNEVGLFCAGKNRSPYDIKKEACNTHECPNWSDWMVWDSNCTKDDTNDATRSVSYTRRCEYKDQRSEGCAGVSDGESLQMITKTCDETPLSFARASTGGADNDALSINTVSYVLFGVIGILVLLLVVGYCIVKRRRKRTKERALEEAQDGGMQKSHSFVSPHRVDRAQLEIPNHAPKSKWKTPENYEEIAVKGEAIHGSFASRVASKTAATMALPIVPPPLRTSFQDLARVGDHQSMTYTCMDGSPNEKSPIHKSRPINGKKVFPDLIETRKVSNPEVPKRGPSDDYPPPPPDLAFDGSLSYSEKARHNSLGTPKHAFTPAEDNHVYLESKSLQRGKANKSKEHIKRHKSEEYRVGKGRRRQKSEESRITRENSVGFSRLHSSIDAPDDHMSSHGHLYAEIHDNTRF